VAERYNTAGLRTDERQWLIYDDEVLGAYTRGLEAWALMVLAQSLRNVGPDRFRALNGIATWCHRVAEQRLVEMKRNGGAQEVVSDWVLLVSRWAAGKTPLTPDVARGIEEFHSVATRLDSRGNSAGITGPGVHRQAIRGD
jgi:hypothetical protein